MIPVLDRAAYALVTARLRALAPTRFHEDVMSDAKPPHVCASISGTFAADFEPSTIIPWMQLGAGPCASLIMTSDPDFGVNVFLMVRGAME